MSNKSSGGHCTRACCTCGYTCGSRKAWTAHTTRNPDHALLDPSALPPDTPAEPPAPRSTVMRATGAAGFRDALKGVGHALASAENSQRAMERSLASWSKSASAVANQPLESRLSLSLKHDGLPLVKAAKRGDADALRACLDADNVDAHDDTGLSALAWAFAEANAQHVELATAIDEVLRAGIRGCDEAQVRAFGDWCDDELKLPRAPPRRRSPSPPPRQRPWGTHARPPHA